MLSVASSSIPAAGKPGSGGDTVATIPPLPSSRASVMCALASKRSSANVPSNHFFGGAAAARAAARAAAASQHSARRPSGKTSAAARRFQWTTGQPRL